MTKWLGFDIEVARWPEDDNVDGFTDFGITCAGVAFTNKGNVDYRMWYKHPEMNDTNQIVDDLLTATEKGWKIVTVNGASFDFKVLAQTSDRWADCRTLALNHIDLLAVTYAHRCHRLGLDAMAKGAEVESKLKSVTLNDGTILSEMDGAKAPEMWTKGETQAVMAYLKQDCRSTLETAMTFEQKGRIEWISQKGRHNSFELKNYLSELDVEWCIRNYNNRPPRWLKDYVPFPETVKWLLG